MFKFKPTSKTYSDPVASVFRPGVPFGPKYSAGDICLLHDQISSSKIYLNSVVLRQALLDSAEFLEDALSIKITDANETKKVSKPTTAKPLEVVEEIIGEPKPKKK